jgi:hypothetical protein
VFIKNFSRGLGFFCVCIALIVTSWMVVSLSLSRSRVLSTSQRSVRKETPCTQSIRCVDFANFTYPAAVAFSFGNPNEPIFHDTAKTFALREGSYQGEEEVPPLGLGYLNYGDVTNDGSEEALVTLTVETKGTAIPHVTYVYGLNGGVPKLLWSFSTGDRLSNGLWRVYADNGGLVIERYIGNSKDLPFRIFFARVRYQWRGDHFEQVVAEEILETSEQSAAPIMEQYVLKKGG